jgi:hypothetical protein
VDLELGRTGSHPVEVAVVVGGVDALRRLLG